MRQAHRFSLTKIFFILSLLLINVLVACSSGEAEEIRIGLIAPLTGDIVNAGQATLNGAQLAVEAINAEGGLEVDGQKRKVVLFIEDNEDRPEGAVAAVRKLINQDKVVAIVGPQASRNAIPAAEIAEQSKMPLISPWSTNPETTLNKKYVFRVAFIDSFQGQAMASFALDKLNAKKAAVLYDIASPYNKDIAEIFQQFFQESGGDVVAFESYTTGQVDFSEQLKNIQNSGADVLFLPNYYNEVPLQVKQAREMGLDTVFIGSDTWGLLEPASRQELEGAFFSTHYATDIANEQAKTFIETYRQTYNADPDDVAALTYDAFGLLFQAIQNQNEATPESIRQGLAGIGRYTGVTGVMEYQGSGDPIKSAVILQIKDGEFSFNSLTNP